MDNELLLFDRVNAIKDTINKYGEENFYLSFSGGKDSTILHYLLDIALPNNKIPRVYINTGIEYNAIVDFVKELASNDERFIIIQPNKPIKQTLEKYGYPFKSKQHSHNHSVYENNKETFKRIKTEIEKKPELLKNYDYIHNLPKGAKTIVKYFFGIREREREREICMTTKSVPNLLKYQFTNNFNIKLSDECCYRMKKQTIKKWEKENNRKIALTGMRKDEGGMRILLSCIITDNKGKVKRFHPLVKVDENFETWFIEKYNIKLCKLYYPPYNFKRTGCKGCPFSLELQEQLETMELYMPNERKQCEIIWKPVYDEYRKLNYRLKKVEKIKLF